MIPARSDRDGTAIRVSSACTGGHCVGVEVRPDGVVVADTKAPEGARLQFTAEEWRAFVAGVKAGEFDPL